MRYELESYAGATPVKLRLTHGGGTLRFMSDLDILPEALREFLIITEVDHSRLMIDELFQRKFGHTPPTAPHHLAAFYRAPDKSMRLLSYSHMYAHGDIFLSGGACTDGDVVRMMQPEQRAVLSACGGARRWVLKYAFSRYADRCAAFFAYCGDARAMAVCQGVGFVPTEHQYLIVHWHKPLHEGIDQTLIAKAHAIGPF